MSSQNTSNNIKLINFGCKVNLYDGQIILNKLQSENGTSGKIFVVNTCTVTQKSARECQKTVAQLAKKNPDCHIVVTGCDATINSAKYKIADNVSVFTNFQKDKITLNGITDKSENISSLPLLKERRVDLKNEMLEGMYGRTRAFVKIEDGCDLFCSFCIIPYVRGLPSSKPIPQVLDEIQLLLDNNYKEIVLSGIHLGCYGKDLKDGTNLAKLIEKFDKFSNYEFRFRISSIEINELTPQLQQVLKNSEKFCQHFHIPLQSGSNRILSLMNRRYTVEEFQRRVEELVKNFNDPTISTDVIIGFPTETETDFNQTLQVCKDIGFFKIHIFPYSDRYITKSSTIAPKCSGKVIKERYKLLLNVEKKNATKCYQKYLNVPSCVLVESKVKDSNGVFGYTEKYLKTIIYTSNPHEYHNKFVKVMPTQIKENYLIAYY